MKLWFKFGLLNAVFGLFVGIHVSYFSVGEGYYSFLVAAPLSAFIIGCLFWKIFFKDEIPLENGKIIIVGILTGSISHYLAFVLFSIYLNICFWTTGLCTNSSGGDPVGILSMLSGGIILSFFSLLIYGWITVPISICMGFLLKHFENKKNGNKISID